MMVLQIFAIKKVLFLNYPYFYSIDVCGNGYLKNIVTTSLFMTLVKRVKKYADQSQNFRIERYFFFKVILGNLVKNSKKKVNSYVHAITTSKMYAM